MMQLVPQDRILQRIVEEITIDPVQQVMEDIIEVLHRTSRAGSESANR